MGVIREDTYPSSRNALRFNPNSSNAKNSHSSLETQLVLRDFFLYAVIFLEMTSGVYYYSRLILIFDSYKDSGG